MSLLRFPVFYWALITLFFGLTVTILAQGPVGRDNDLPDQSRRLEDVAAQKVEADVRTALREAERLISSDPAKAVERLKSMLGRIEDNTVLSEKRRETLKRLLRDRIH